MGATPDSSGGRDDHDHHQLTPAFSCPLCSSFGAVLAVNSRAWTLPVAPRTAALGPLAAAQLEHPRRERWNILSPRAPPFDLPHS